MLAATADVNTFGQRTIRNEEKMQTFDLSLIIGKSQFIDDGSQNFLIFQPILKTFTIATVITKIIIEYESKGLSNEKITPLIMPNNCLSPKVRWMDNSKITV